MRGMNKMIEEDEEESFRGIIRQSYTVILSNMDTNFARIQLYSARGISILH
jgi:hypothetical protein